MKCFRARLLTILLGVLVSAAPALAQPASGSVSLGDRVRTQVAAISAGANNPARGAAITKRLDELGIKYRLEPFTSGEFEGKNIVVEPLGAGRKQLMLGAHYDRVATGSGAIDNASGSATVLELLAALKANPLKNYSVSAVFFDQEERGLVGSKKYILAHEKDLPAIFINFDVFGYGDTLWVGAPDPKAGAAAAIGQAAAGSKFPSQIGPAYPPSDHLSFLKAGIEALSFSLIDGGEIPGILKIFAGERPDATPRVLTIIHSPGDTADKIDAPAISRAIPVVEQAIRAIDARP